MSVDPRAASALALLRLSADPEVIAALLPVAAGAFHPSHRGRFAGRLAGSHRFASQACASLGAYLTDDPDTLAHILVDHRGLREDVVAHLVTHPGIPTAALLSHAQQQRPVGDGFLARSEIDEVLAARLGQMEVEEAWELVLATPSEHAARAVCAHRELQAHHGLAALCEEVMPGGSERSLIHRKDLGVVLARCGGGWDESVLAGSIETLIEAACGNPGYAVGANAATKALEALVGSTHSPGELGRLADPAGVVRASTVRALLGWRQLAGRAARLEHLSAEACEVVLEGLKADLQARCQEADVDAEAVARGEADGLSAGMRWRGWYHATEALAGQGHAPVHVLAALPAAHPRALAGVLTGERAEVWVLAASLAGEHERLPAGVIAEMAKALLAE